VFSAKVRRVSDQTVEISLEEAGKTLEAVVRKALGDVPWSKARDLVKSGRVLVDARRIDDATTRVRAGQVITLRVDAPRVPQLALTDEEVVYVDQALVVVRKAAGVLTIPTEDNERDTLLDRVRAFVRLHRKTTPGPRDDEIGIVHRLDRETSGLVVFARTLAAKRALAEQFEEHSIERRYLAIAHGRVHGQTVKTTLVKDRGDGLRGSFGRSFPQRKKGWPAEPPHDAQEAITHLEPLEMLPSTGNAVATLVSVGLETGRQHQIRIHLAELGHPVLGESVYIRDFRGKKLAAPRNMLHATVLGLVHPSGRSLRFEWAPPEDFQRVLQRLRQPRPSSPPAR
jgi:23S rRNA pseudouridine1911/1915/1917 synthase